jgi:hypothetical protein
VSFPQKKRDFLCIPPDIHYLCIIMSDEHRSYLEFLRFCIDEQSPLPPSVHTIDWEKLYGFARRQTVEATYWSGIERLDKSGKLKLSQAAVLSWMARRKNIEKRNNNTYKRAAWVWGNFQKEGFRSCLLKGQGNALLYPNPTMRTPGDIDIWVEGGDKKVIAYIDSVYPGQKRSYHHIDFITVGKVPIEVHYRPSWMSNPIHNRRLQRWFEAHADECFSNKVEEWGFCVPTFNFNTVYLLSHIYSHLLREGVGLRHIVDYYHLLKQRGDQPLPSEQELRHLGLYKIAGGLMWVLNEVLGLDRKYLICEPNKRHGRLLLDEILHGGNFGKHDDRMLGGDSDSAIRHNMKTSLRDFRLIRYYPSECFFEPFFRMRHFYWRRSH